MPRKSQLDLMPTPSFHPIVVGTAVELHPTSEIESVFDMRSNTVIRFLRSLRVPVIWIGGTSMFSVHALETALFAVSQFGAPGFAAPGSRYKATNRHIRGGEWTKIPPGALEDKNLQSEIERVRSARRGRISRIVRKAVKDASRNSARAEAGSGTGNDSPGPGQPEQQAAV